MGFCIFSRPRGARDERSRSDELLARIGKRHGASSADYLHDLLRWSIGRFSKLGDLYAHMSEFMTQLQENDTSSKKQFNVLAEKVHELSVSITGLQSATRVAVDDSKANQKQTL